MARGGIRVPTAARRSRSSFTLAADDGSTVSSDALAGERYVLYFYPKDDTPGCTTQACGLRDSFGRVTATGVKLFGVSPDSVAKHIKFREKYGLPFRLLSDRGHELAEKFGVWIAKSFRGVRISATSAARSSSDPTERSSMSSPW